MSSDADISGQVIPVPKGGGALQGISEIFTPGLFTGTGNFSLPITLPYGRNGFQPELALARTAPGMAKDRFAGAT